MKILRILTSVGLLFLAFGVLVLLFDGFFRLQQWRAAREFVPIEAEVVESRVHHYRSGKSSQGPWAEIVYRWSVGGRTYSSNRYTAFGPSSDLSLLNHYPVGSKVTAYYDPKNPESSVLVPDMSVAGKQSFIAFGIVPVALGAGLLVVTVPLRIRRALKLKHGGASP